MTSAVGVGKEGRESTNVFPGLRREDGETRRNRSTAWSGGCSLRDP